MPSIALLRLPGLFGAGQLCATLVLHSGLGLILLENVNLNLALLLNADGQQFALLVMAVRITGHLCRQNSHAFFTS